MRILITGGSGLLGSKISEKATEKGREVYSGYNTHKSTFGIPTKLDICNRTILDKIFRNVKPEVVIHAAALTNVDRCEKDKKPAWKVNVEGTRNIAELSRKNKAFSIYISTDYVFSGDKGMYKETDETDPVNHYGTTKLEGEKAIKAILDRWCIARPSVIYGSTPAAGKVNFALWVLEKLERREPINIITDQHVSPTLNTNLAEMILEVTERKLTGVYHLAGATPINRYDFAQLIAETFKLDKNLIEPAKSEQMTWKAKRPKNTSLNVDKATRMLQNEPLKIQEALNTLKDETSRRRRGNKDSNNQGASKSQHINVESTIMCKIICHE